MHIDFDIDDEDLPEHGDDSDFSEEAVSDSEGWGWPVGRQELAPPTDDDEDDEGAFMRVDHLHDRRTTIHPSMWFANEAKWC